MDLFIRSQNGETLMKASRVHIESYCGEKLDDNYHTVWGIFVNNSICVGFFKTKDRALEILNDIEHMISPIYNDTAPDVYEVADNSGIIQLVATRPVDTRIRPNDFIYKIPKE